MGVTDVSDAKRLIRIRCSRRWLTHLFRGDMGLVAGLPEDVTIDNMYDDPQRDEYAFVLQSKEFDPVAEGQEIPTKSVVSANLTFDDPIA